MYSASTCLVFGFHEYVYKVKQTNTNYETINEKKKTIWYTDTRIPTIVLIMTNLF